MKACLHVFLVLLGIAFFGRSGVADELKSKNYLLAPIQTDLQRTLLFSTRADAYAMFDVGESVHEGKFDSRHFDVDGFRKDLALLAQQIGTAKPSLQIYFRYSGVSLDPQETKAMENAVTAMCRQAGFARVGTGTTGEGGSWQDKVAKFASLVDKVDATESPVEDEFVRVYPVRTKLSRFLLGDADDDCFVELRQPIDGRFSEFSDTARQVIGQRVAQLKLPQKRKLTFHCMTTNAGRESARRYFGQLDGKPPLADAFIKELGFQASTYSMMPMSVSPEDLLGKPAPDFTLDALGGGEIHLYEMIHGRVAVVAFWGVACGACRVEAPHLTALYNQYAGKGLAVIAVNGYDESKENVEQYVRDKGLTHPIALMGRKVAEDKYTVASYPVTYLLDSTGAIVDYHLGFEPGDEKVLAAKVARLLAEREKADDRK
jgi:thiol-disulfide isomerase/thioredoxin